jgi:hypothetical protein
MRISISALKELAKKYKLDHVIVFATEGKQQHIATYGRTIQECSEAADFGNKMKETLGWPEQLRANPLRVKKLKTRIKELEVRLKDEEDARTLDIDHVNPDEA